MKIGNSAENTLVTNVSDEKRGKFKIQATGKAFSILSNALYQFKVRAVVREIGCNAYDAHIDAGNTTQPFKVTLPSAQDPHFVVRDYGIGLPEDKFVEIYTTYFGSSKSDSNDHTGGLGLGSKTPFIMSKSFTVHSYYNGTEYMWHSFVNDNGEPDVMMLQSKATSEPNGLKVIVPIGTGLSDSEKNALYRDFRSEAINIYQWFDTIPEVSDVTGSVEIESKLRGTNTEYDSIQLKGADHTVVYYNNTQLKTNQSSTIHVKMGNVIYPFDLSNVRNLDRFGGNIIQTQRVIDYIIKNGALNPQKSPIVVEVAMGDVDMAPSRESLSLSNTTELTIINAIVRFVDLFFARVQDTIDNAATTYEKYQALYLVPAMAGREFTVDGKQYNPHSVKPNWLFATTIDMAGRGDDYLRSFGLEDFAIKYRRAGTRGILPMKKTFDMSMYGQNVNARTIILVDKVYKGELRLWINANIDPSNAVVVVFGEEIVKNKFVTRPLTDAEMEPFLADNHPQVLKFSQLKKTPVITPRAVATANAKATLEDAVLLRNANTSYNYFTNGNAEALPISEISDEYTKAGRKPGSACDVYIALRKTGQSVMAELALTKEQAKTSKDKTLFEQVATWSRSQARYTTWNTGVEFLNRAFYKTFAALGINQITPEIGGVKRTVTCGGKMNNIKQIVLNKDAYSAIVDTPEYPNVYSVDRAVRELVIPELPFTSSMYTIVDDTDFVGYSYNHGRAALQQLVVKLNLHAVVQFHMQLLSLQSDQQSEALHTLKTDIIFAEHQYDSLVNHNAVTHEYTFAAGTFNDIINRAVSDAIPGTAAIQRFIKRIGNNYSDFFATGYYGNTEKTINMVTEWVNEEMNAEGRQPDVIENYIIDYMNEHCLVKR